jgi:hypothetical protein
MSSEAFDVGSTVFYHFLPLASFGPEEGIFLPLGIENFKHCPYPLRNVKVSPK